MKRIVSKVCQETGLVRVECVIGSLRSESEQVQDQGPSSLRHTKGLASPGPLSQRWPRSPFGQ